MTASTSVHSNALNFMSCLKSGVDSRTGLYNVSINLPELQANDLRGPGITPTLSYSPLLTQDIGYGLGWSLQLSHYDPDSHILSLGTGETFCVDGTSNSRFIKRTLRTRYTKRTRSTRPAAAASKTDSAKRKTYSKQTRVSKRTRRVVHTRVGKLTMSEKKLDTFHFYKVDDYHFRVAHKSGLIEILKVHSSGNKRMAWPEQIIAASGHRVWLTHKPFGNTQLLESIRDDLDRTLLNIQREGDSSVKISLYPEAGPKGEALAQFIMYLTSSSRYVSRITLPTENQASWRFEYGIENDGQVCIKHVETPTGSQEFVHYQDRGHEFPVSAHRPPLPRVTRHVVDPGFEQPQIDVRYTYKQSHNFLGAGLNVAWEDNGLDNLFKYLGTYDYACTESLWVDDVAVRSIERTFNRFHLVAREVTTQNQHRQTVETTYYIEEGKRYSEQPAYCQMPKDVKTTWTVLNQPERSRSETISNTYDSHGNLLMKTRADGIVETQTWYPAEGVEGECPPNAEGFVCQLKERTVTPALSDQDGAPTLTTRFRYAAFPTTSGSELPEWIVPQTETLVHLDADGPGKDVELQQTVNTYSNLPDQPFLHGRLQRQTLSLNGKSTHTDYVYSLIDSAQLHVPVQQITKTLSTDFDNVSSTSVRQLSPLTGHEWLTLAEGVENRYEYDALNRLTRETTAKDTDFEATRDYQYILCATVGEHAEQVLTNAHGVKTRSCMDGIGRAIYEEQDNIDTVDPKVMCQTYAALYSPWNNVQQETAYDYRNGQQKPLTRYFAYDDWNQQCTITGDDGVQSHQHFNPIGNDEYDGAIQENWIQSSGSTPDISNHSEAWLNLFGKPIRLKTLGALKEVVGTQHFLYDGLGRCTSQTDELGVNTQFGYDAWSRMATTLLPDNSVITRDYAAHSSAELPIALEVIHEDSTTKTLAGTQGFDGLQRLTQTRTGPRIECYAYEDDQKQVKTRTTAKGDEISFTYNPALTSQPLTSSAKDEQSTFTYNPKSGRLTGAENVQGKRTYAYDVLNRLKEESWLDEQKRTWKTQYETSFQGLPIKRTELQQGDDPGLDTVFGYDDLGRVESIVQGNLKVCVEYDSLSRPGCLVIHDLSAGTALTTRLEYDHQGREVLRRQRLDQQTERTLEQVWNSDGLLKSRHLKEGDSSLLCEQFKYDVRGRLTVYDCSGSSLPRDAQGRKIVSQVFSFDALDNIKYLQTTFYEDAAEETEPKSELAIFNYAIDDPCQLSSVTYSLSGTTANLRYDENGNQLNDEHGQTLSYDSQGRLVAVHSPDGQPISQYRYDSHDDLISVRHGHESQILRFYQDQQLSSSVQDDRRTHYLHLDEQPLGQQSAGKDEETLLLLTDQNNSVLGECQQDTLRAAVYNAYGGRHSDELLLTTLGFNGEVRDTSSGWYLLGKGYRAYNPTLMRFQSPDSLSPFASGGVNPYMYCLGNPIALRDPTGHDASTQGGPLPRPYEEKRSSGSGGAGWMSWIGVAVSAFFAVTGVMSLIMTAGLSAPISVPMIGLGVAEGTAATVALVATTALTATAAAAGAVAAVSGDQTASYIAYAAGFASMGTGLIRSASRLFQPAKLASKAVDTTADGVSGGSRSAIGTQTSRSGSVSSVSSASSASPASSASSASSASASAMSTLSGGTIRSRSSLGSIDLSLFEPARGALKPVAITTTQNSAELLRINQLRGVGANVSEAIRIVRTEHFAERSGLANNVISSIRT